MHRELRRLQRFPHDLPDATLVGQRPGLGAEDPLGRLRPSTLQRLGLALYLEPQQDARKLFAHVHGAAVPALWLFDAPAR